MNLLLLWSKGTNNITRDKDPKDIMPMERGELYMVQLNKVKISTTIRTWENARGTIIQAVFGNSLRLCICTIERVRVDTGKQHIQVPHLVVEALQRDQES